MHSPVNGHLCCFCVLAVVSSAADAGKALSKVQALVHLVQKEFGQKHKGKQNTHTHTHTHEQREQRAVYSGQKWRTQESVVVLASQGLLAGFFDPPFIFSPLNGWRSFWLGVEYSWRGLGCGLDCTRLHQLLVLWVQLLKPLHMLSKSCFPFNFPSLVESHTWKVV